IGQFEEVLCSPSLLGCPLLPIAMLSLNGCYVWPLRIKSLNPSKRSLQKKTVAISNWHSYVDCKPCSRGYIRQKGNERHSEDRTRRRAPKLFSAHIHDFIKGYTGHNLGQRS